jgi:hypothetical protein
MVNKKNLPAKMGQLGCQSRQKSGSAWAIAKTKKVQLTIRVE